MKEVTLIFPHQLYKAHPALQPERTACLVEETLFFNQFNFHKKKLVLHRASMKRYADHLSALGFALLYVEATDERSDVRKLLHFLAAEGCTSIHYADVTDNWLERRIRTGAAAARLALSQYPTPNFLNTMAAAEFFDGRKTYFQTDFYIDQRKKRKLLLEANDQPVGGKWSYDAANRERFPKKTSPPPAPVCPLNKYSKEAIAYIEKNFADNYGEAAGLFGKEAGFFPTDFKEAEQWLDNFMQQRFRDFGIYEDALVAAEPVLHHSVLTPMLNIGLLHPQQIIDKAIDTAVNYDIPLNSLEGFLRQVMGWREFIRIVYEREGSKQRTRNYWGFTRKIPASFWEGSTGIVPVDAVIKKVLKNGYSHHIERLMVMGNFMLLCEFDPNEVYRWFMEMYIDSYDWVMVPNVYGMTQFADGGLMTTKPYISGSNYIMKMGDFTKGPWQQVWDGLFWRFMHVHRQFFLRNPRLGMLVNTFDKMDKQKREAHLAAADSFLATLYEQVKQQQ
ncbi:MAG TPA: cryptochrome/photolyase family protein [Chitinophagaceae bacterium]|nr:cryptochrome/photolyase family protein [Chitinophagaceae bacterium]